MKNFSPIGGFISPDFHPLVKVIPAEPGTWLLCEVRQEDGTTKVERCAHVIAWRLVTVLLRHTTTGSGPTYTEHLTDGSGAGEYMTSQHPICAGGGEEWDEAGIAGYEFANGARLTPSSNKMPSVVDKGGNVVDSMLGLS